MPFPIVFELAFEGKMQVIATYKRPNETDASRWVLLDYLASDWLPQETLAELVVRVEQAQAKQCEVDKTSARLA